MMHEDEIERLNKLPYGTKVWYRPVDEKRDWRKITSPGWGNEFLYVADDDWADLRMQQMDGKIIQISNDGTDWNDDYRTTFTYPLSYYRVTPEAGTKQKEVEMRENEEIAIVDPTAEVTVEDRTESRKTKIKQIFMGEKMMNADGVVLIASGIKFEQEGASEGSSYSYSFEEIDSLELYVDEATKKLNAALERGDRLEAELEELKASMAPVKSKKIRPTENDVLMTEANLLKYPGYNNKEIATLVENISYGSVKRVRAGTHSYSKDGFAEEMKKAAKNYRLAKDNADD